MLSLLLCSSVYGGAVWFHFASARPRDGLASFASRSLTSTSRLSSSLVLPRLPRTLVFPVLPLRFFFLLGSLIGPRFSSSHSLAPSCPAFRFIGRRKLAEKEQEKSEGVRRPAVAFFFFLLFFSIFCFIFLPSSFSRTTASRETGRLSSQNIQRIPP